MSMFNDISWGSRDNEKNANQMLDSFLSKRRDLEQDNGHSSVLVSEKKWNSISEDSPQGEWDKVAELMMLKFGESGHPVFRATSPLSRGQLKSKGGGKLSIHYRADLDTIKTVFRTIISVNQLSLYGAVAEMCEEYEECLRSKVVENCRFTIALTLETITTVFRTIISVNQLSLYGAVAEMCEESCHDRTGGPVVRGQSSPSFVPSVIKTKHTFE